jgi:hypothetical protein
MCYHMNHYTNINCYECVQEHISIQSNCMDENCRMCSYIVCPYKNINHLSKTGCPVCYNKVF